MYEPWRTAAFLFGLCLAFRAVLAVWTTPVAAYYPAMAEAVAAVLGIFSGDAWLRARD